MERLQISISRELESVCEIFGFDPHYVANDGRFSVLIANDQVANDQVDCALLFTAGANHLKKDLKIIDF